MRALVGYTGFIGSNLADQSVFDCYYNSSNIEEIRGKHFEEVFFAGLSGVKWKANVNPEEDKKSIDEMVSRLMTVSADRFVHISSIDVYNDHVDVDEDTPPSYSHYPYGSNRAKFEDFVQSRFSDCISVRLPIVFGKGFKKNYLFDLVHKNCLDRVFLENEVQFYDVGDLTTDINFHRKKSRRIVNLATEPVKLCEIVDLYFKDLKSKCSEGSNYFSRMKSKYAVDDYFQDKESILEKIGDFVQ